MFDEVFVDVVSPVVRYGRKTSELAVTSRENYVMRKEINEYIAENIDSPNRTKS